MRVVLGIDAAWTQAQRSGVAVAVESENGWHICAVAASYEVFLASSFGLGNDERPSVSEVTATELIDATKRLAGQEPDLVAIDMPMAHSPITGRRAADQEISKHFASRWCGTHSPNALRPGAISDRLRMGFAAAGYPLCTERVSSPGLIEVYPHPALVQLCREPRRLPYKVGRTRSYWPKQTLEDRRMLVLGEWASIVAVIEPYLKGTDDWFCGVDMRKPGRLKSVEDMLDAIICCVCAIRALDGAAEPYGDSDSAIWVPEPDEALLTRTLLPGSPYSARAEMRRELFADRLERGEFPELLDH